MKDYFESPIFVLGLPRSGTSMLAGCLGICGAWTGRTVPGGAPNPKGFFEHIVLREYVTKKLLMQLGCDPLGVRKLPPANLQGHIPGFSKGIKKILENDGYCHDRPWLYKDAKLTLIWRFYLHAFPNANWLIVNRNQEDFIDSCLRTHFMRQHSVDRTFWKWLAGEYEIRINLLKESGANVHEISSKDIIDGNFKSLEKFTSICKLKYDEDELNKFVCPEYWHKGV